MDDNPYRSPKSEPARPTPIYRPARTGPSLFKILILAVVVQLAAALILILVWDPVH